MSNQLESNNIGEVQIPSTRLDPTLSRRRVLKLFTLNAASSLLTACIGQQISEREQQTPDPKRPIPVPAPKPEPTVVEQPIVDSELRLIGQELDTWEIITQNSRLKMTAAFEDVRVAADVLTGRINPRIYLSHLRLPITLGQAEKTQAATFLMSVVEDHQDRRKIEIAFPKGNLTYPWIKEAEAGIRLSDDLKKTSTAKLPFVVKELMHLVDIQTYYQFYLGNNPDAQSYFQNPARIPTPPDQILFARGRQYEKAEESSLKQSPLSNYIDAGTGIKTFAPLYATWQLNEQHQGRIIPDTDWSRIGNRYVQFLKDKGLLVEKNGLITWEVGKTPKIDSAEFIILADEYVKRFFPPYKILEGYRLKQ